MKKQTTKKQTQQRNYGWRPQHPDMRDLMFSPGAVHLPPSVDLRASMPPIYNQGNLGSCGEHAFARCLQFDQAKQGLPIVMPSRLFMYWNVRKMEGTLDSDAGSVLRDVMKTLTKQGVCAETLWAYSDDSAFKEKPPTKCFTAAKKHRALKYMAVMRGGIRQALASGYPVAFGISVYDSFESDEVAKTGVVPMPRSDEQMLGGHAICAVGYNEAGDIICANSWGEDWGQAGYFILPGSYAQSSKLASDFWCIETID